MIDMKVLICMFRCILPICSRRRLPRRLKMAKIKYHRQFQLSAFHFSSLQSQSLMQLTRVRLSIGLIDHQLCVVVTSSECNVICKPSTILGSEGFLGEVFVVESVTRHVLRRCVYAVMFWSRENDFSHHSGALNLVCYI